MLSRRFLFSSPSATAPMHGTREELLQDLRAGRVSFASLSKPLRNHKELALAAVQVDGFALAHASDALRADREVVLAAVQNDGYALLYVTAPELREDVDVALAAVRNSAYALKFVPEALRTRRDVLLAALTCNGAVLSSNIMSPGTLGEDRELWHAAIRSCWYQLQDAPHAVRTDEEIVLDALRCHASALLCAHATLRKSRAFALRALAANANAYICMDEDLRSDEDVALAAVARDGMLLQHVRPGAMTLRVIRRAVEQTGYALPLACRAPGLEDVRRSPDWIRLALDTAPCALRDFGVEDDPAMVRWAVARDGAALQVASERLRADVDVCAAAVFQRRDAILHAHPSQRPCLCRAGPTEARLLLSRLVGRGPFWLTEDLVDLIVSKCHAR